MAEVRRWFRGPSPPAPLSRCAGEGEPASDATPSPTGRGGRGVRASPDPIDQAVTSSQASSAVNTLLPRPTKNGANGRGGPASGFVSQSLALSVLTSS